MMNEIAEIMSALWPLIVSIILIIGFCWGMSVWSDKRREATREELIDIRKELDMLILEIDDKEIEHW
jgi:hypothetical protein